MSADAADVDSTTGTRRMRRWLDGLGAGLAPAFVGFVGLACLAANGIHVLRSMLLVPLFCLTAGLAFLRGMSHPSRVGACLLLAVTLGFSATWLGVAWNVERFDWGLPTTEASERRGRRVTRAKPQSSYEDWLAEHGASTKGFETLVITGFPIQSVEGHGRGGAPDYLPPGKGLAALLANFLLWTAAFAVVVFFLPARALKSLTGWSIGLSAMAGLCGSWLLLWMQD